MAARPFLAVAADDEQAVVDAEPQAEHEREVGGERRHLGELRDGPQPCERSDHREETDGDREERRHRAPVEQDQEQGDRGQREQFGAQEVRPCLLANLARDLLLAADADVHGVTGRRTCQMRGERGQLVAGVGGAAFQADEQEPAAAVAVAQGGAVRLPVGGGVGDVRDPLDLALQLVRRPAGRGAVDVTVTGGDQQGDVRVPGAELVAQHLPGPDGLGPR